MDDDYEIPCWKQRPCVASYASKSKKILDENQIEKNRQLYMEVFHENPETSLANFKDYEKELFLDVQNNLNKSTKLKQQRKKKEKPKLEDIFEKSDVYQNLQKIKDMPLNIRQVDKKGNVVKHLEYYFDYEENKHDVIVINDDDKNDDLINKDHENKKNNNKLKDNKNKRTKNKNKDENKLKDDKTTAINKLKRKPIDTTNQLNGEIKRPKILNSTQIDNFKMNNQSLFDLSLIRNDRSSIIDLNKTSNSFTAKKLNRTLIDDKLAEDNYSANLNKLCISLDETKNLSLNELNNLSDEEKILKFCKPNKITKFNKILKENDKQKIIKVSEGSFGEIFKLMNDNLILKIIRVTDDLDQLLPEIIINFALNEIQNTFKFNNFIRLKRCCFVEDKYPIKLLNAWNDYNLNVKESENDNPSTFNDNDRFILLFLEIGGEDLEQFDELEPKIALSIFKQTLLALAIGEYSIKLEHRDLHLGNILIKDTNQKELNYEFNNKKYKIETNGKHVNIIDYSLTHLTKNGITIFQNLNESPEIFEGKGDIQYDVYRKMKKLNNGKWNEFCPKTNIIWLEYLLEKLIGLINTKKRDSDEKKLIGQLRLLKTKLKKFDSCLEALKLIDN